LPFFQVHFVRSAICHSFNCTLSVVQFAILPNSTSSRLQMPTHQ
jgi:hypothetical protein